MCDFKGTQLSNLSKHVKSVHQPNRKVICTECNKSIQENSLNLHWKVSHSGSQTKYNCKICTFQSIHKYSLESHAVNIHQKRKFLG